MGKPIIFHCQSTIMNRYIAVKLTNKKMINLILETLMKNVNIHGMQPIGS